MPPQGGCPTPAGCCGAARTAGRRPWSAACPPSPRRGPAWEGWGRASGACLSGPRKRPRRGICLQGLQCSASCTPSQARASRPRAPAAPRLAARAPSWLWVARSRRAGAPRAGAPRPGAPARQARHPGAAGGRPQLTGTAGTGTPRAALLAVPFATAGAPRCRALMLRSSTDRTRDPFLATLAKQAWCACGVKLRCRVGCVQRAAGVRSAARQHLGPRDVSAPAAGGAAAPAACPATCLPARQRRAQERSAGTTRRPDARRGE
jgi:hypothetical protein